MNFFPFTTPGLVTLGPVSRYVSQLCELALTLLTSVHRGKPLRLFGLTYEVSVVGASRSLTMGYHYGPSADLLVLVCVYSESVVERCHMPV